MNPWASWLKATITVSIAVTVIAVAALIVHGCMHYDALLEKSRTACASTPGKQWINDNCVVIGEQQ